MAAWWVSVSLALASLTLSRCQSPSDDNMEYSSSNPFHTPDTKPKSMTDLFEEMPRTRSDLDGSVHVPRFPQGSGRGQQAQGRGRGGQRGRGRRWGSRGEGRGEGQRNVMASQDLIRNQLMEKMQSGKTLPWRRPKKSILFLFIDAVAMSAINLYRRVFRQVHGLKMNERNVLSNVAGEWSDMLMRYRRIEHIAAVSGLGKAITRIEDVPKFDEFALPAPDFYHSRSIDDVEKQEDRHRQREMRYVEMKLAKDLRRFFAHESVKIYFLSLWRQNHTIALMKQYVSTVEDLNKVKDRWVQKISKMAGPTLEDQQRTLERLKSALLPAQPQPQVYGPPAYKQAAITEARNRRKNANLNPHRPPAPDPNGYRGVRGSALGNQEDVDGYAHGEGVENDMDIDVDESSLSEDVRGVSEMVEPRDLNVKVGELKGTELS